MDVRQAAQKLGVHTQTIYNMLADGRLKAVKVGASWDIPDEQIHRRLELSAEKVKAAGDFELSVEYLDTVYSNDYEKGLQDLLESCQEVLQAYDNAVQDGGSSFRQAVEKHDTVVDRFKMLQSIDFYIKELRTTANQFQQEAEFIRRGLDKN